MDRDVAEKIIGRLGSCIGDLNTFLVDMKPYLSDDEYRVVKRDVARIINTSYSDVEAMIVSQYPDLNPLNPHDV